VLAPPGSFCLSIGRYATTCQLYASHMPTTCQPNDRSLPASAGQLMRTPVRIQ
jgi:hypothetical protein